MSTFAEESVSFLYCNQDGITLILGAAFGTMKGCLDRCSFYMVNQIVMGGALIEQGITSIVILVLICLRIGYSSAALQTLNGNS